MQDWYNIWKRVISGDWYPRDSSHVPTNEGADLGSSTIRWRRHHVASGEFAAGSIKMRLSYSGLLTVGHGWMLCDGRLVNQANYDVEHGEGAWEDFVGSSPLEGLYLPNAVDRYLVGASAVAQDGTAPITAVGNAGSQLSLIHNHRWYDTTGNPATHDSIYDITGAAQTIDYTAGGSKNVGVQSVVHMANDTPPDVDLYSEKKLSAAQDIRPESIQVLPYMRII